MVSKNNFIPLALSILIILNACQKQTYKQYTQDPKLYRITVKKLNNIILENNFPPVTASRNYVYANIVAYEIIAASDPKHYKSLTGQVTDLVKIPVPKDASHIDYHLAAILAFCKVGNAVTFPEGSMDKYVAEVIAQVKNRGIPSDILVQTSAYADSVALYILKWSKKDHYARTRSESRYAVNQEPGRWVPTPPMYAQGMEAHWAEIRPMVLDSANQISIPLPPKYDMTDKKSQYYKNTIEVEYIGDHLTVEDKHIADFWDDNPFKLNVIGHIMYATKKFSPVGHWMNIVGIATQKKRYDFNQTVSVYTASSIAIFDSFISCWHTKYTYNYVRPETVINKYLDQDWRPYIQSPPFPEYTSGHAVISASVATILENKIGKNFAFRDTSESEFGISPLNFTSFYQASDQAGHSRVLGGIHFTNSCMVGGRQGKEIGSLVLKKLILKKE